MRVVSSHAPQIKGIKIKHTHTHIHTHTHTHIHMIGPLWGNDVENAAAELFLNVSILGAVRNSLRSTLSERNLVKFLLSIVEAEMVGSINAVEEELEYMDEHQLFLN